MSLDLNKLNKVYLSGIGGIGLSALAYYFMSREVEVEGSDIRESEVTKRLEDQNIKIHFEQKASNITSDVDLFLYSSALPKSHPELLKAKESKIPCMSYFEFLGELSKTHKTIAVTGTNGKTSTTAMLGLIMEKAGLDPTVIVGSLVPQWKSNFRPGKSEWLVVEACEWQAHMLHIKPQIIVLTNVAEDHLDYYKDLDDIKEHFMKFVSKLPLDGLLVKNDDDANSRDINFENQLSFGKNPKANFVYSDVKIEQATQSFMVSSNGEDLERMTLQVPGAYNISNAMAAITASDALNINRHQVWNALNEFNGTWRRFEKLPQYKSNVVISDYAHHPDSIRGLLKATKDFYPDKEIVAIFQPHHQNRTKKLLHDFAKSFDLADKVIISEIYRVKGRDDEDDDVSSNDIVSLMKDKEVYYAEDFKQVKNKLRDINPTDSVLLFIGAGDIDNLARNL